MIQQFVDKFMEKKPELEAYFKVNKPGDYQDIVKAVVNAISDGEYNDPDPDRIHKIDDGDYQGTLLFVIAAKGYQPSDYWSVFVGYGSCSGCDTLQSIDEECYDETPNDSQLAQYMTLALHIVQGIKKIGE